MEIVREKKKEKREKIEFIFYPIIIVRKIAIITGITGQDGSYLSEFLLDKGYEIHGLVRNKTLINESLISHLILNKNNKIFLHYGDLNDISLIKSLIKKTNPDEIYNLGALSQVKASFDSPEITANINAIGALRILESIKKISMIKKIKFYQASTAELYGKVKEIPQKETTTFFPRSPYAISKLFAYWLTVNYREAYNLFAVNGILFNHESPRRRIEFVTRKITHCVASIYLNKLECFSLGNLEAKRDWGHAKDFVEVNLNVLSN